MICPDCGCDNIDGADECTNCQQDLTHLEEPTAGSVVERVIMEEAVRLLNPPKPICVASATPLGEVVRTLIDAKIGCVLVVDDQELVGIFTERDLLLKIAGSEKQYEEHPIREWMTPNPATVEGDDSIAFAIHKMDVGGYRHLPVMEGNVPVGVISVRDVIRCLADYLAPANL